MSAPSADDPPSILQGVLFGALGLLALLPLVALICKAPVVREWLTRLGCTRISTWCERVFPSDAEVDRLERAAAEENSIPAVYRLMFGRPTSSHSRDLALRLAAWRDDLRYHAFHNEHTIKLQQIQLKTHSIPSYEPPEAVVVGLAAVQLSQQSAEANDEEEKEEDTTEGA